MLDNIFSEGYGIVPKKFMKMKGITVYAKAIMAYFMSYTGAGKLECWPSMETISEDLEISVSTTKRSIKLLIDNGLIEKTKLFSNDPMKKNNLYRLTILETKEDIEEFSNRNPKVHTDTSTKSSKTIIDKEEKHKSSTALIDTLEVSERTTNNNIYNNNNINTETTVSNHKKVMDEYYLLYQAKYNTKPDITAASGAIIKNLLASQLVEVIILKLKLYFQNDYWFTKGSGRDIKQFKAHYNEIIDIKKQNSISKETTILDYDQSNALTAEQIQKICEGKNDI